MPFQLNGTVYVYTIGSDIDRDGMYLEVAEKPGDNDALFEIFYSDVTHKMTLNAIKHDIPTELLEWAISIAKQRLPATSSSDALGNRPEEP